MLTLLLLIAGFRPGLPPAARVKALGACAAVTAEDIQRALGINFRGGNESSAGAQQTCDYAAGTAQISITIQHLKTTLDIPGEMEAMKLAISGSTVRRIDESAFFLEIPNAGAQLHMVRNDGEYVMVSILGLGDAQIVRPAAEQLAHAAFARL